MYIQGMGQSYAAREHYTAQNKSDLKANTRAAGTLASHDEVIKTEQRIDMRNISPNEYNELVRSGVADLPVPMVLPGGRIYLDGRQADMGDVKTDYIGQIEQSIEFNQDIGDFDQIAFLKDRLAIVKGLHGQTFIPSTFSQSVDIKA
ncbi:hypothetical protein [Pseudoalteromonas luteoviolacea]|uniref:Uncharacterized protein n=1 Tax=Pseudoalteromonas luteoviolacea H33 TaxID=1365251 RepID=A0A166ZTP9_9GAMM|nr:hypothetical protein [Pseudoalteromonas luteoviolacea]KZN44654.1 hypothetical protein N476_26145 [Pseudoalteromonas luteoviolacea H33]KZN71964.1 hypothetical protein N477_25490 [Pseudoalteromonas luteoviolacea H33-S]MBQ4878701.1 hypothetical protein [Pseudoalteromonas luteoviolacea]MBQ4907241.1 hypothetical protein [Pseudoalteromonas luteoviolacea]